MGRRKTRREYGEGSVSNKPRKDGRYGASFTHDGKRKFVYGDTREEAKQKLKEKQEEARRGTLVDAKKVQIADYLEYWMSVKKMELKESSQQIYAAYIRADIVPELGTIQLQKLGRSRIQQFVSALRDKLLKPKTIRYIVAILRQALDDAVKWKMLSVNPCVDVTLPRREEKEMKVLDAEQARQLLALIRGHHLEVLITLALATGMRRGELLGLKWGDIDFEAKSLRVQRSASFLVGRGMVESTPKTERSRRTIQIAPFAVEALRRHRRAQETRVQAETWHDHDLVFCKSDGSLYPVQTLIQQFRSIMEKSGLPVIRFHDLRHSCATLLLKMGVDIKVIQSVLGHTSLAMTLKYLHFLSAMGADVAARMDDLLGEEEAN